MVAKDSVKTSKRKEQFGDLDLLDGVLDSEAPT